MLTVITLYIDVLKQIGAVSLTFGIRWYLIVEV